MKKFITYLLCTICAVCVFTLSACSTPVDNRSTNNSKNDEISTPKVPSKDDDIEELAEFKLFADVGDKYDIVVQPFLSAAEYIVADLNENNVCAANGGTSIPSDAEISAIRFFHHGPESDSSLTITFRQTPKVPDTDTDSDFLYKHFMINLDKWGASYEDWYEYACFLDAERGCAAAEDYAEILLPHAERIANKIKSHYDIYKANGGYANVKFTPTASYIVLKSDSFLSETHKKIITKLNTTLEENNYPLLTDQDILISISYDIGTHSHYDRISLTVDLNNYEYYFSTNFNKDKALTDEWVNYYKNTLNPGYWSPIEYDNIPANAEYSEFFEKIQIENIDFTYFLAMIYEFSHLRF